MKTRAKKNALISGFPPFFHLYHSKHNVTEIKLSQSCLYPLRQQTKTIEEIWEPKKPFSRFDKYGGETGGGQMPAALADG
jgi:hypothetical protein